MIKILSDSTINKIAAGEVIERPASVVKELVENAIDAQATKINIRIERAGKNLITVADNGIGLSAAELKIAIKRHATSKLNEDDLEDINTLGFRGEALPSIAAISRFKLISKKRPKNKDENEISTGNYVKISGGEIEEFAKTQCDYGTIVEVRDLFFATPARLKFLRTDRTEINAILNIIKRLSLSHPDIYFSLSNNEKEIFKLSPQTQETDIDTNTLCNKRIADILSDEFIENAVPISFEKEQIKIYGYSSVPTYNKATSEDQFLFINNRPVRDRIINIALKLAYKDFIENSRHPMACIFIELPNNIVDVNVHPTKTEVRFHNPQKIQQSIIHAINNALSKDSHKVSNIIANNALKFMHNNIEEQNENNINSKTENKIISQYTLNTSSNPSESKNDIENLKDLELNDKITNHYSSFNINKDNEKTDNEKLTKTPPTNIEIDNIVKKFQQDRYINQDFIEKTPTRDIAQEKNDEIIQSDITYKLGIAKAQLHKTYIISQTDNSIILVDQHAAHERLGYEKLKIQYKNSKIKTQNLLIPEIIELNNLEKANSLSENIQTLNILGLNLNIFNKTSVMLTAVPILIAGINYKKLILDITDHIHDIGDNVALNNLVESILETYACHYAIRAGRELTIEEMNELLRQIETTPFSAQCNHGRPTYVELKLKDIEKLFGRK